MRLTFNKAQGVGGYGDYNVTIKVFLAYAQAPEAGLDGTLGIAVTEWYDYCVMCKLSASYGMPVHVQEFRFK